MAESLSEVSSSMEGLEDEGKKKSKFKAFKSLFGKKKKKEPEDVQEGSVITPRLSSSSLKPVMEIKVHKSKPKSSMGAKSISHDSVFCLESEPKKLASKPFLSPDPQRSRPQERFPISRSLPRVTGAEVLGALSKSVDFCDPKSELWVSHSKVAEIPPPCSVSVSCSVTQAKKDLKDLETDFARGEISKSSPKKFSVDCSATRSKVNFSSTLRDRFEGGHPSKENLDSELMAKPDVAAPTPVTSVPAGREQRWMAPRGSPASLDKMSGLELFSELDLSQFSQSSSQLLSGFSTPATSQSCLDSSAAKHKIALNPRKQKRKKTASSSAKAKQEEQHASLATKEKAITKTKHADRKEPKRDRTGPSGQEQSYKPDSQDKKKTRNQSLSTDAASSTGHSASGSHPRRRRKRIKNEMGFVEKGLLKSMKEHDQGGKAGSSPAEELSGREHSFLKFYLEKQSTEQNPTAEAAVATPQKMPSDKGNVKGEMAAPDVEAQTTPAPQPTPIHVAEFTVSGPPLSRKEGFPEGKKKKEKASSSSRIRQPSTSQEGATVSRTAEAQACTHPSQAHREEGEASSLGLQKFLPRKELSLESTPYHKGRHPRGGLRAFSASVSSITTKDDVSMPRSPLPLRRWPPAGEFSSDSYSSSEYESSSEVQLGSTHSFQILWNPQDDDVFFKAGNVDAEQSKMGWQQPLGYSSQSLRKSRAGESESDSSSDDQRSYEMTSAQSFQSLDEFEGCSESASFIIDSVFEEKRRYSQALLESEENEVSTESSSYLEKYHSSEDMSSSEEEQPPKLSKQALGQSRDHQKVFPVSKSTSKESSGSAKPVQPVNTSPPIVSPSTQLQPPILGNLSVAQSRPVESIPPSHTVRSWMSPQSEHQVFAEGIAADWDIFSQPPIRPVLEQDISAGPELGAFEQCLAAQSPRYPSQPSVGPTIKKEASLGTESAAFEGSHFMEPPPPQHPSQPPLKPFAQHQASAFERDISMDSRFLTQSFQPWMKPQGKQSFSGLESTAFEGNSSIEHAPPSLLQPMKQPYQNVPLESEAGAAKIITTGPLHTKYSTHSLLTPQSQPVAESTSVEGASMVELLPPQPSVKSKFQPQMTRDPVHASTQGGSPMESAPAQHIFQTQPVPKFKQVPTGSDGPEAQGIMSVPPGSSRCPSQLWLTPNFEQIPVLPGNVPTAWAIPFHPPAPRMPSQPLMGSVVRQSASTGSMNTSIQQVAVGPLSPRNPLQPWPTSPFEQISAPTDKAAKAAWSIPVDPAAPRELSQPLMGSVVQRPVSTELVGISGPQSSSVELMPSRFSFQSRVDPETYAVDEGVSPIRKPRRYHSQPPRSTEFKEEVSSDSLGASGEWGIPIEPMLSKYAPHPWLGPESECQASSLEGFSKEGDIYKEAWLPRNPPQSITKHQVQKTSSMWESPFFEGGISWKPPPPNVAAPFLMSSKVKDTPSSLQSAEGQDSSKKQQGRSAPSHSFVKFMADQIFAENTAGETVFYGKPMLKNRSRPSRSLLKPKLEEQVFLRNWDDEPKEDTTLKKLPPKQPPQSPRRPKESQEVLSYSKGDPAKWSSSAADSSQPLGKLEYRQKVSASLSFPEEWKRSQVQLPSTQPSQGFDVARSQPQVLSTAPANVPVEWRSLEGHRPPGQSAQALVMADYQQQQVYLSSASAATEKTTSRKNTGSRFMPKGPDSSKKTMKNTQGYGNFIKSTPTSVTKPGKFTWVPAQKAFASTGAYTKEVVPQRRDEKERSFLSTCKSDVENVFGVRLRKTSQRSGIPEPIAPLVPASKEQTNRGTPQGYSGGHEKFSHALSYAQKQGNRPRYEGTFKKPAVFRPPEKTSSLKSDYTAEPPWISVAKQRQKGFVSHFSKKPRTRAEIRAETKEQRYESKYDPGMETPRKEHEPTTDIPSRMTFSPIVPREETSRLFKSTKSVVFDDQNKLHPYTRERDTRRSSSVPPKVAPPKEPVWFSMAKKKAQAWSQMSDIMQ
ncbi:acrosomal protein KIAA1210 homolog [Arvicola amphibius]|uniref:acrosomal protein KIAA1210 homolog n=1 Tax=Arvicola amphibius TaxID=1047088 RepID=UPI001C09E63C|nr:acrosomal protein KIAA1210 homolog [Arvicola amphibius]